jgi:hypothetical protein
MAEKKMWHGDVPKECEACHQPFTGNVFFDTCIRHSGRTIWGLVCAACHMKFGFGLGTGKGQKYDLTTKEKLAG